MIRARALGNTRVRAASIHARACVRETRRAPVQPALSSVYIYIYRYVQPEQIYERRIDAEARLCATWDPAEPCASHVCGRKLEGKERENERETRSFFVFGMTF